jgi:hypothetical protein
MNYADYKNNKPWLSKDEFTWVYVYSKGSKVDYLSLEDFRKKYKDTNLVFEKEFNEVAYKQMQKEYNEEESRCYNQFKQDLLEEYYVTDNPKAEKCFSMAWEKGHSSGYESVANEFDELVDLIQ